MILRDLIDEHSELRERVRHIEVTPREVGVPVPIDPFQPAYDSTRFLAALVAGFSNWSDSGSDLAISERLPPNAHLLRDLCWEQGTWNIEPPGAYDSIEPVVGDPYSSHARMLAWEWTMLLLGCSALPRMIPADSSDQYWFKPAPPTGASLGPDGGFAEYRIRIGSLNAFEDEVRAWERITEWSNLRASTPGTLYGTNPEIREDSTAFPRLGGAAIIGAADFGLLPSTDTRWPRFRLVAGVLTTDLCQRGWWHQYATQSGGSYTGRFYTGSQNAIYIVGGPHPTYNPCFNALEDAAFADDEHPLVVEINMPIASSSVGSGIQHAGPSSYVDSGIPCPRSPTSPGGGGNPPDVVAGNPTGGKFAVAFEEGQAFHLIRPPRPYELGVHGYQLRMRTDHGGDFAWQLAAGSNAEDNLEGAAMLVEACLDGFDVQNGPGTFPTWWGGSRFPLITAWAERWRNHLDRYLGWAAEAKGWQAMEMPKDVWGQVWFRIVNGLCHLRGTIRMLGDDGAGVPDWNAWVLAAFPSGIEPTHGTQRITIHAHDAETGALVPLFVQKRQYDAAVDWYRTGIESFNSAIFTPPRYLHFDGVSFRIGEQS